MSKKVTTEEKFLAASGHYSGLGDAGYSDADLDEMLKDVPIIPLHAQNWTWDCDNRLAIMFISQAVIDDTRLYRLIQPRRRVPTELSRPRNRPIETTAVAAP